VTDIFTLGKIAIYNNQVTAIGQGVMSDDQPPLCVLSITAEAALDNLRRYLRQGGNAVVAFLAMSGGSEARGYLDSWVRVHIVMHLGFLQAEDVWFLAVTKLFQLMKSGSYTIDIKRYYAHDYPVDLILLYPGLTGAGMCNQPSARPRTPMPDDCHRFMAPEHFLTVNQPIEL
jgi:hypothetical protein